MIVACPGNHFCGCRPPSLSGEPLHCSAETCINPLHTHLTPEQRAELSRMQDEVKQATEKIAELEAERRTGALSLSEARTLADLLARHIADDPMDAECSAQLTLDRLHDAIDAGLDCR